MKKKGCFTVGTPLMIRRPGVEICSTLPKESISPRLPDEVLHRRYGEPVRIVVFPINWDIAPLGDIAVLWKFGRTIIHSRFDLVHSIALEAGLLGKLAALLKCEMVAA